MFPLFPLTSQRTYTSDDGPPVRYYDEGFLIVQNMIFESFMKAIDKNSLDDIPEIFVQVSGRSLSTLCKKRLFRSRGEARNFLKGVFDYCFV